MWTLVAYDADGNVARATLTEITGEADDHVRVVGNDIYIPELANLIGIHALHRDVDTNGDMTQVQISSPSLRAFIMPFYEKIEHDPAIINPDVGVNMHPLSPIPLEVNEALNAEVIHSAVATTRVIIGAFLSDGVVSPVMGDIRTVRCTTVVTGLVGVWTSGNITFDQDLPVGRYQIVGAATLLAGCVGLFRFIPVGGRWRPGGPLKRGVAYNEPGIFRYGKLGVWMEFNQLTPPRIEILTTNTSPNPVLYLDLIKVA